MSRNIVISKFRGMFTDVEPTHVPDNGFLELVNLRIGRDKRLEKIPGYAKYSDYLFDSPINNIEQISDVNDRNLFMFSRQNIYRMDIDSNVSILKEDYPITQTEPYDPSSFSKTRAIVGEGKAWCVDENLYPFFIYNLSDESGVNLNIWAKLLVEGANTIKVVDSNDETIIYKTITIIPQENDGSNLNIRYNDESNVYIFSDTWAYKFNYSAQNYELVKSTQIATLPITDMSFKDGSFGIIEDSKEFDYDFIEKVGVGERVSFLWKQTNSLYLETVAGKNQLWGASNTPMSGIITSSQRTYAPTNYVKCRWTLVFPFYAKTGFVVDCVDVHGYRKTISFYICTFIIII